MAACRVTLQSVRTYQFLTRKCYISRYTHAREKVSILEYCCFGNKVLSSKIQGVLLKGKECTMLEKMEAWDHPHNNQQIVTKEKAEEVLQRLQALKSAVSALRLQCEELRKLRLEEHSREPLCRECGNSIKPGLEITIKDSDGTVRTCYHQKCFKQLLRPLA
jgi:hypothetical protein